ncbi:hypothetical protein RBG61_08770 [Paludicola sp. MB14-C6]|uniref:hypothetical protein n=1 Tax=Paludihabitans sp. MB14-C6 TaxID=3070656 RepID=UPI0027DD45D0|nr:hypothetical protein [Paludicola sp. MB14-C6]WMJ22092.1 hypothetical protein RBG61_08770 [Paludicola sp. MB14-C6]
MKVEFVKRYTLKQAIQEADVVAIVEITSWLSEENYSYHTYFKAKMINQLINKIDNNLEDFTLVQHGSSKATLASYPLFQKGDQLLLCLKKNKDGVFYIVGDLHTSMQYRSNENQEYLLPFVALIDEFSESLVASLNSYVPDLGVIEQQLNKELLAYAPKEFFHGGDYKPLNKRQPHYADKLLEQIQKQYP